MAIADQLDRLNVLRRNLAAALTAKSVEAAETEGFETLVPKVEMVETGGGGISGYNIISGTYTPATDITSYFVVYKTESLANTPSEITKILNACTAFSFPVISGLDDEISTFPCALLNLYSCRKSVSCNARSASSISTNVITSCLKSSTNPISGYGLDVYLACNSSYPLIAGRTYQWALLIPEYIQI